MSDEETSFRQQGARRLLEITRQYCDRCDAIETAMLNPKLLERLAPIEPDESPFSRLDRLRSIYESTPCPPIIRANIAHPEPGGSAP